MQESSNREDKRRLCKCMGLEVGTGESGTTQQAADMEKEQSFHLLPSLYSLELESMVLEKDMERSCI